MIIGQSDMKQLFILHKPDISITAIIGYIPVGLADYQK